MTGRPPVSVVVPFAGSDQELQRLLAGLAALNRRDGDEVIVADNRDQARRPRPSSPFAIIPAAGIRSPGFARNRGSAYATTDWLVFIDADTRPEPALLDAYFEPPPSADTAVLAGGIDDVAARITAAARHSADRGHLGRTATLSRPNGPYAQSANCAIRRRAFEQVGGFDARVRAGEDADLCYRLVSAGWRLEERPGARLEHRSRETLRALITQLAGHGSGAAWLNDKYPGTFPPPSPRELTRRLGRSAIDAGKALAAGDAESTQARALDLLTTCAFELGRLLPNRASVSRGPHPGRGSSG